ncbi:hypothetical protein EVAR_79111_1 [Eumeta japonica]|uniref:Uncharacterized protein n=1 Tax=Eumeta variegata TaxID=151549 RepID=A0A4C1X3Z9_EUMVA|nr:hypothetical protein EVAR_79111_1 [Eumeta japonica]
MKRRSYGLTDKTRGKEYESEAGNDNENVHERLRNKIANKTNASLETERTERIICDRIRIIRRCLIAQRLTAGHPSGAAGAHGAARSSQLNPCNVF